MYIYVLVCQYGLKKLVFLGFLKFKTNVLQTQWELRGLDYILKPSDFVLSINGILYSEKRGISSRLKGHLKLSVKFAIPPSMAMIPEEAFKSVGEMVCFLTI